MRGLNPATLMDWVQRDGARDRQPGSGCAPAETVE
jgi:hypothetical protein